MSESNRELRVILIGGSSSVGKSPLAESLAAKLGWTYISTDKLARNPGGPWKTDLGSAPEPARAAHSGNCSRRRNAGASVSGRSVGLGETTPMGEPRRSGTAHWL